MKLYLLPSLALLVQSATAQAEETYAEKTIGWWQVYGWDNNCWMTAQFADGTELSYSWDVKSNDSYVAIRNQKWTSIESSKRYPVRIEIDNWSMKEDAGGAVKSDALPPGVSFFIDDPEKDLFLARIATGKAIRFFVGDNFVGSYSLKDSGRAARELALCSTQLSYRPSKDPFEPAAEQE